MRLTVLIPALNEAAGIQRTLARIPRRELRAAGYQVEVVVVDGQSTDGTAERARAAGARVLVEPRRGYGRAYKTGFSHVEADWVLTGDADDTYPFEEALRLVETAQREGLDFATVNRYAGMEPGSMSRLHRLGNGILNVAVRLLFGARVQDSQSGMWLLSRRARQLLPFETLSDGMAFSGELKVRAFRDPRLKSRELAGSYRPRLGQAKLASWRDGIRNLSALLRLRFRRVTRRKGSP